MDQASGETREFRFGGHQSFAVRTAWLPKAAQALEQGRDPLSNTDDGIVELGLGKNMVEALRCWVGAFGVAERGPGGAFRLTPEGGLIFGSRGFDRFLEDQQTLWLLHWRISILQEGAFFAWELLINRWSEPDFSAGRVVAAFVREAERTGRRLSPVSLRQHFDVWLHTYVLSRVGKAEDGLDSPLAALGLVRRVGERETANDRREPVYAFDFGPKRTLRAELFRYCLLDWWERFYPHEETVSFQDVVSARMSPGRVFKMTEAETRDRLAREAAAGTEASVELVESINQFRIRRRRHPPPAALLAAVYDGIADRRAQSVHHV